MTQSEKIEQYNNAVKALEILFPNLPPLSEFAVADVIHLHFSGAEKQYLDGYIPEIEELLVDKFGYADDRGRTEKAPSRYYLSLNKTGIAAIKIGGHKKYQKKINKRKLRDDYPEVYDAATFLLGGIITFAVGMLLIVWEQELKNQELQSLDNKVEKVDRRLDSLLKYL